MSTLWQSLYNDISLDVSTLMDFTPSAIINSVKDKTRLFPFKIVSLQCLLDNNLMFQLYTLPTTDSDENSNVVFYANSVLSVNINYFPSCYFSGRLDHFGKTLPTRKFN